MFCPRCGFKVKDGMKFCPVCGCKVESVSSEKAEVKKEEIKKTKVQQLAAPTESVKAVKVVKAIAPFGFLGGIFLMIATIMMVMGSWIIGNNANTGKIFVAVGSYINFGTFTFGLVAGALLLAYAIMTLIKIRKNTLRANLAGGIYVALLSIMVLTFDVILLINSIASISLASSFIGGGAAFNLMGQGSAGILFVLLFLCSELALTYKFKRSADRSLNIKMLRGTAMNAGIVSILLFVYIVFVMMLGFIGNPNTMPINSAWWAYIGMSQHFNGITGTISILFMIMIAFAVMEFLNNKPVMKKQIIKWAVIGGVTLTFFIVGEVCTMIYIAGPIVSFFNWSCCLACGIVGMISAKQLCK